VLGVGEWDGARVVVVSALVVVAVLAGYVVGLLLVVKLRRRLDGRDQRDGLLLRGAELAEDQDGDA
jgi:positive regulator of sigma E activity